MPTSRTIISGFVFTDGAITLYMPDGTTRSLNPSFWNLQKLIADLAAAYLAASTEGNAPETIEIALDDYQLGNTIRATTNHDIDYDENTGTISVAPDRTIPAAPLMPHLQAAAKSTRAAQALANFLKRFSRAKRKHGSIELLDFMALNRMPISNSGHIIAFKSLAVVPDKDGTMKLVDKHSRSIPQKPGTRVRMPEKAVDDDRRHSCSTGYHVCSITYLKGYHSSNDALTLTLIDPADVIAVPRHERDKMRASCYFVAHLFKEKDAKAITAATQPLEIPEVARILNEVAAGHHIDHLETVYEGIKNGERKITITPTGPGHSPVFRKSARPNSDVTQAWAEKLEITPDVVRDALEAAYGTNAQKLRIAQTLHKYGATIKALTELLDISGETLRKSIKDNKFSKGNDQETHADQTAVQDGDKPAPTTITTREHALALIRSGTSIRQASRETGIPATTLRNEIARRQKPESARDKTINDKRSEKSRDAAIRLIEAGLSIRKASRQSGIPLTTLRREISKRSKTRAST